MTTIFDMVRSTPCAACGKAPSLISHIRDPGNGGTNEFYNLIPLCTRHWNQKENYGLQNLIAKNPVVKDFLVLKGWMIGRALTHGELKEV
jgi:hypothetical protein